MAEATVFVGEDGEPTTLDSDALERAVAALVDDGFGVDLSDLLPGGVSLDRIHIVSEWSLRIALYTLQRISATTRCPQSQHFANAGLRAVGLSGDVEVNEAMMPAPIVLGDHEKPERIQGVANPYKPQEGL